MAFAMPQPQPPPLSQAPAPASVPIPIPVPVPVPQQNPYGPPSKTIAPTPGYLSLLRSMAHPREILVKNGFVITQLSQADIDRKKRCRRCNARCNKDVKERPMAAGEAWTGSKRPCQKSPAPKPKSRDVPIAGLDGPAKGKDDKDAASKPHLKCQYHTGRVVSMYWNCCRAFVAAPGCTFAPEHLTRIYTAHDLQNRYQFHPTPASTLLDLNPVPLISFSHHAYTPCGSGETRRAVALDCEMGVAFDGESELIRLTLIDYFTSEILLDSLISPTVPMKSYSTKFSGISRRDMEEARKKGKCLEGGYAAARDAVWRWVGPETVVVGHAVHNDLSSLRWIHPLVVDSLVLAAAAKAEKDKREEEEEQARKEAEAEEEAARKALERREEGDIGDLISFDGSEGASSDSEEKKKEKEGEEKEKEKKVKKPKGGTLGLKKLTKELLGRDIQVGKSGHDSLEDAVAARDLVHWYVAQKSELLQAPNSPELGFW